MPAILGKKLGMTRVFDEDGDSIPVTVVEAGPCTITAIRKADRDGYDAVQLAGIPTEERKLTKAELGHLKKAGADRPAQTLVEFRDVTFPGRQAETQHPADASQRDTPAGEAEDVAESDGEAGPKIGDAVTVAAFEPGEKVKVSGGLDRQGLPGHDQAPQLQPRPRHPRLAQRPRARLGRRQRRPRPVFKGMKMPGQMGNKRVTQRGLEVVERRRRAQPAAHQGLGPRRQERHGGGDERWLIPRLPCSARQGKADLPARSSPSPSTSRSSTRPRAPT